MAFLSFSVLIVGVLDFLRTVTTLIVVEGEDTVEERSWASNFKSPYFIHYVGGLPVRLKNGR